ncbi:MAG: outer membrane protein assembly factor BamD [Ignavibacteriaceae bacterium]|nr:outer membrane protein assembly factor BamD [Ignavibacteriaceae bacterium]
MRNLLILTVFALYFWGCASSIDTVNLGAEDRLKYALNLYEDEDYQEALNELQSIILQFPGNTVVDNAQYYLGMTRYKRGEYILGAYEFSKLIKNYPASESISDAQYMLADCYYRLSPNFQLDQQYTQKGIEEFQAFIDFFPADEKVAEAEQKITELNGKLAHKEYNTAVIYEKLEYYTAALKYYENVLDIFHDSEYAPLASYNKIKLLIYRDRNAEALEEADRFLQKFPDSGRYSDVESLQSKLKTELSASK